jgi:hypothetical protein
MNRYFKQAAMLCIGIAISSVNSFAQTTVLGQELNTITTAVPFLRICPDSRAGAMGDLGIATESDANDTHWNGSKLITNKKKTGVSLTYNSWLRDLVPDVYLAYLSGYTKLSDNDAISSSLRYFNLGSISLTDINAQSLGTGFPREWAFDVGYSRKLSDYMSVGTAFRYINSNLAAGPAASAGQNPTSPGRSFAADISGFYTRPMKKEEEDGDRLNLGFAITNIGTKISYNGIRRDFIPTNFGLGAAYIYKIDEYNKLKLGLDMNKLLVPTPGYYKDSSGQIQYTYDQNTSVGNALFSSWNDAPGGFKEEMREITYSIGTEYAYQNQFFARGGYFYEHKTKGARQYASLGLGFKYTSFTLNLAYIVPSGSGINRNPLSNSLRFTLLFDFEAAKKKADKKDEDEEEGN